MLGQGRPKISNFHLEIYNVIFLEIVDDEKFNLSFTTIHVKRLTYRVPKAFLCRIVSFIIKK